MAAKIERTIKIVTQQQILPDVPAVQEGYPMRRWSVKIVAVGPNGNELPASFIDRVVYKLHPSFEKPVRTFKKAPFKLEENGWGEFDMLITLTYAEKSGTKEIPHDLHFQAPKYEVTHVLEFTKPSQSLLKTLSESGETPGYTPPAAPAPPAPPKVPSPKVPTPKVPTPKVPTPTPTPAADESKKRKPESTEDTRQTKKVSKGGKDWTGRPADMDRLAQGLQKLQEDDLLQIVRMVNEHKTPEMYVKNDLEDLYTLGDPLLRLLWDFTKQKIEA